MKVLNWHVYNVNKIIIWMDRLVNKEHQILIIIVDNFIKLKMLVKNVYMDIMLLIIYVLVKSLLIV